MQPDRGKSSILFSISIIFFQEKMTFLQKNMKINFYFFALTKKLNLTETGIEK